jgi:hypothetical protein
MKLEFFSTDFRKMHKYQVLLKSVRSRVFSMRRDGQKDMRKEVVVFRNFANAPKNLRVPI